MYPNPRLAYDRTCDCRCPIHHNQQRSDYNHPDCHCLTTCATQPMTLLAPQTGGALFLDRHAILWYVPSLQPGHWDWRYATPVTIGHPLAETSDLITELLSDTHTGLLPLTHRL